MLTSQGYGFLHGLSSYGYGTITEEDFLTYSGITTKAAFVLDRGLNPAQAFGYVASPTVWSRGMPDEIIPGYFGVPILGESMSISDDWISETLLEDKNGLGAILAGNRKIGGTVSLDGYYEGLERLMAAALGFENPVTRLLPRPDMLKGGSPAQIEGLYEHLFEADTDLTAMSWQLEDVGSSQARCKDMTALNFLAGDKKIRRGTLFVMSDYGLLAYRGCHVTQMSIKGVVNSTIKADFNLAAHSALRLNYPLPLWQPPRSSKRILFSDTTCFIRPLDAPLSGAYFRDQDIIPISDFSLTLNNNLSSSKVSYRGNTIFDDFNRAIDEPYRNSKRDINGSLSLPRMSEQAQAFLIDQQFTAFPENRLYAMRLEFTSETGGYRIRFDFPKIRIRAANNLKGAGISPVTLDFIALKPDVEVRPLPMEADYLTDLVKYNEMIVTIRNSVPGNLFRPEDLVY